MASVRVFSFSGASGFDDSRGSRGSRGFRSRGSRGLPGLAVGASGLAPTPVGGAAALADGAGVSLGVAVVIAGCGSGDFSVGMLVVTSGAFGGFSSLGTNTAIATPI